MKKGFLVFIAVFLLLSEFIYPQIPQIINYQAELLDQDDKPLNGSFLMTFTIYNAKESGIVVWSEYQTVTAEHGYINVYLGKTLPISISFDKEYWLEIMIENSGSPYPRVPFTTVPYSFRSENSSKADVASLAKTVPDGSITQAKLDPNIHIPPGGNAGGDLSGTYPEPQIRDSSITNKKIALRAIKVSNINTEKAKAGQVLTVNSNGSAVWADDSIVAQRPLIGIGTVANPIRLDDSPNFIMNNEVIMYKNNDWTGGLITPVNFFTVNQAGAATDKYALVWDHKNLRMKWDIPVSRSYTRYPIIGSGMIDDPLKIDTANVYKNYILFYDGSKWTPGIFNEKMVPNNHLPYGKLVPGTSNGVLTYTISGWMSKLINAYNIATVNQVGPLTDGYALTWNNTINQMEWRTVSSIASVTSAFPLTGNGTANPLTIVAGTNNGQMLFWDNAALNWSFTPAVNPVNSQVLKWNNASNRIEWSNDGLSLPYVYTGTTGGQELLGIYRNDIAAGANYIARFENNIDGRALYLEGNSSGTFTPDPGDIDGAVLVVTNTNPNYNRTAIKTYGDIWANGKVGAEIVASVDCYVLGLPGTANSATFTTPSSATSPVIISRDIAVNGSVLIGTTTNNSSGMIRWNGTNFQGYNGTQWINFDSDMNWALNPTTNVLSTSGDWGLNRYNNSVYGTNASTHINLGFGTSVTGMSGQNYQYCTVIGGINNTAQNAYSLVGGGSNNTASGLYSAITGGAYNTALGERSVIAGGSYLTVWDRSFGFRGGIGGNPSAVSDVSAETESFHIVDANFHFNNNNVSANFRLDGDNNDNVFFLNGATDRIGIGTNTPGALLQVNGTFMLATGASVTDISTDNTMTAADDATLPTQLAVKTYVDNRLVSVSSLWTDNTVPADYISAESGGIATNGVTLYGSGANTHINLGFGTSVTGMSGQNYQYCTVIGGINNTAQNAYSLVGGGSNNTASGLYSTITGGAFNTALGERSVIAGGSYLTVGDRSFGFRGGIGGNPSAVSDVSAETESFHIVDANFHFNNNNVAANFRLDGDNNDNVFFLNGATDRIGIGTNAPGALLDVNGTFRLGTGSIISDISSDVTMAAADNTTMATQLAVKTYVDNQIAAIATPWTANTTPAAYISALSGGIATDGVTLFGTSANTHINLGFGASETGLSGQDYGYCTVLGGYSNVSSNIYSVVTGGQGNLASGNGASVLGGIANEARGQRSVVAGGSQLIVGDRSFGFRGGIGSNPVAQVNVSGEPETFHIVDANFHFNYTNSITNFRLDGDNTDNVFYMDAATDRIGIGTNAPLQQLHVNGILKIGSDSDPVAGSFRFNANNVEVNDGVNGWIRIGNFQLVNGVLVTAQDWGLARNGATLYGTQIKTHVNLGGFETLGSRTGTNTQNKKYCAVLSGSDNVAANDYDVVTGGKGNSATGETCYVGGGLNNSANGYNSTITGGTNNFASGSNSTIGGGGDNIASADGATIAGGIFNTASTTSLNGSSTVGGGAINHATNDMATVAGGTLNTASGYGSVVSGGESNTASGSYSVIPGGTNLSVGDYSFGFRGNLDVGGSADVSAETNTFHIVDAHFHFNSKNQNANFVVDGTSDNSIYALASNNYVGFGLNNPTSRITLPNVASVAGEGLAYNWTTYSDGRVKTNKTVLSYGLDDVLSIEPKEYDHHSASFVDGKLNVSSESEHTIGFIAQELYNVIPEAVNKPENESEALWSVNYDKLVPVLVNAIKEQQELIKAQNERIKALEGKLTDIGTLQAQYSKLQEQYTSLQKLVNNLNEYLMKSDTKTVSK